MTAPIQEPTTGRDISGLGYGSRQLFRRPDPVASFTPACLRAFRSYGTGLSVGNGVESAFIVYDNWVNEDTSIFAETLSSGDLQKVSLMAEGIYTVTVSAVWETDSATPAGVLWLDDSNAGSNWPLSSIGNMNAGTYSPVETTDSFNYPVTMSITRKFPRLDTTSGDITGGVLARVAIKVIQYSGGNRDLNNSYLEIFYWGPTREPTYT